MTLTMAEDRFLRGLDGAMRVATASDQRELTLRQLLLLMNIPAGKAGGKTVRALSTELKINKPSVTRGIDRLTECGYVERVDDPDDGRSILALRTKSGTDFLHQIAKKGVATGS